MKLYKFINMFDNWNIDTVVNDNELKVIVAGNTYAIMEKRRDLYNKEVVAFGFYDGQLTVRVK